jgi:hypothetical protein
VAVPRARYDILAPRFAFLSAAASSQLPAWLRTHRVWKEAPGLARSLAVPRLSACTRAPAPLMDLDQNEKARIGFFWTFLFRKVSHQ